MSNGWRRKKRKAPRPGRQRKQRTIKKKQITGKEKHHEEGDAEVHSQNKTKLNKKKRQRKNAGPTGRSRKAFFLCWGFNRKKEKPSKAILG